MNKHRNKRKRSYAKRSRNWCLTINNWKDSDVITLETVDFSYLIIGKEGKQRSTETTGALEVIGMRPATVLMKTPHLQGYMVMKSLKTMKQMKQIHSSCHWEIRLAKTHSPAIVYCKKEGDWKELGKKPIDPKGKGEMEKNRWLAMVNLAKAGDMMGLLNAHPKDFVLRYGTWGRIRKDYMKRPPRLPKLENVWVHGPPQGGKSYWSLEIDPDSTYSKNKNKWWDGYQGENIVVIDDVDKNHKWLGSFLKIWADVYCFTAEIKGTATFLRPKRIIVTSNYLPAEIWDDVMMIEAINRRFEFKFMEKNSWINK